MSVSLFAVITIFATATLVFGVVVEARLRKIERKLRPGIVSEENGKIVFRDAEGKAQFKVTPW